MTRWPRARLASLSALWVAFLTAPVQAQPTVWALDVSSGRHQPATLYAVFDQDDDDGDGTPDARQATGVPDEDLVRIHPWPSRPEGELTLRVRGPLRLVDPEGRALGSEARVAAGAPLPRVQGVAASGADDAQLEVQWAGGSLTVAARVVELWFVGADNRPLRPGDASLGVSRRVTHDASLPRALAEQQPSPDPANFRVLVRDAASQDVGHVWLESVTPRGQLHHLLRHVPLRSMAGAPDAVRRTPFLRLVGDRTDRSAPSVGDRLLQVRLRERVRARYRVGRTELTQDVPVGLASPADDPRTALRGRLRLRVLRLEPGGPPVVGRSDLDAIGLLQEQVEVANEIWSQCGIDFGPPWLADAAVVDPPPPALLSVADGDGLPAAGDGVIRLRAGARRIGPVPTRTGASPGETALRVAAALRRAGFVATVTANPKTDFGAGGSADITVHDGRGRPVPLAPWPNQPLSSDSMQRLDIGAVDLGDGIQQFDNMTAAAGTLEERTLVKLLADDDPGTIDVLVISEFVAVDRQGEAFIEGDGGSVVNALVLDRNGIRFQRQAWVQAHELGHVLLDAPYHPDNIGPDRPWLLMDADARQGRVTGPKRITAEECEQVRRRSGPGTHPALLRPVAP